MVEGWCMKCRKQVEIKDGEEKVTKNNLKYVLGVCPICSTKVSRITGKVKAH